MEEDTGFDEDMFSHDLPLQMSTGLISNNEMAERPVYQPKCSFVSRVANFDHPALGLEEQCDVDEELDQDVKSLIEQYVNLKIQSQQSSYPGRTATVTSGSPSSTCSCTCNRSRCLFRQYLSQSSSQFQSHSSRNDLNNSLSASTSSIINDCNNRSVSPNLSVSSLNLTSTTTTPASASSTAAALLCGGRRYTYSGAARHLPKQQIHNLPDLPPNSPPELLEAHSEFLSSAGGRRRVCALYRKLLSLLPCVPDFLAPTSSDGNTLLMILCCQLDARNQLMLHIITVIIALYSNAGQAGQGSAGNDKTDLLFKRNYQEASALEIAALSNKSIVVKYLALLYAPLNRDVNETTLAGHSVLHLLARKGDESADALETLLNLKDNGKRLIRLDVVNRGHKTPLDVANMCQDSFPDVSFTQVLALFHSTIQEQVEELMCSDSTRNDL